MRLSFVVASAALAISSAPALAADLVDGGFESQGTTGLPSDYCYFGFASAGREACGGGAWSGANGGGLQVETNSPWPGAPSPDGSFYGFVQSGGFLTQTFTAATSGSFLLKWLDAGRPSTGGYDGDQSYFVTLGDGSLPQLLYSGNTTSHQGFTGREATSLFALTAGQTYTLTFQGTGVGDHTAFIDAVTLTAVPEPATWAMMIMGFGAVGAALRRKKPQTAALAASR